GMSHVAVAIDARTPGDIADLPDTLDAIRSMGMHVHVVFLDATTSTLVQRYSESRRRHPLANRLDAAGKPPSLHDCIVIERELLGKLRDREHVIDTSGLTPGQLR